LPRLKGLRQERRAGIDKRGRPQINYLKSPDKDKECRCARKNAGEQGKKLGLGTTFREELPCTNSAKQNRPSQGRRKGHVQSRNLAWGSCRAEIKEECVLEEIYRRLSTLLGQERCGAGNLQKGRTSARTSFAAQEISGKAAEGGRRRIAPTSPE